MYSKKKEKKSFKKHAKPSNISIGYKNSNCLEHKY